MENELLGAVAGALALEFGGELHIYMEEIKQNFKKPCFFIRVENPKVYQRLSGRKKYASTVVVQFFPKEGKKNRDMNDTAQRIINCMTYLNTDGRMLHGYNINHNKSGGVGVSGLNTQYEAVDGVLNISMDYTYICINENMDDMGIMEKLELRKGLE